MGIKIGILFEFDDVHKARLHTIRVTAGQAAALIPLGHLIPQQHVNLETVTFSCRYFICILLLQTLGPYKHVKLSKTP